MGWVGDAIRSLAAVEDPCLAIDVSGIRFPNPVGLAAGFDKNGVAVQFMAGLGFGSIEIGSVSLDPSVGNPRPRLFRLPADRAIVVAYGVPNDGADTVARRLASVRLPVPLGINVVKTNRGLSGPRETADDIIAEYAAAARRLSPFASYLMLNLSCPNTDDGRDFFADRRHLEACLAALAEADLEVPVFLKVSPAGGIAAIEGVLAASDPHTFVSGFMFNLPPGKPDTLVTPRAVWEKMPGAVSGRPSADLARLCIRECYRRMDRGRFAIVGAGGIATGEDAYALIQAGASLVQLLTSLIYEGPTIVRRVTRDLLRAMDRDGVRDIAAAVGAAVR